MSDKSFIFLRRALPTPRLSLLRSCPFLVVELQVVVVRIPREQEVLVVDDGARKVLVRVVAADELEVVVVEGAAHARGVAAAADGFVDVAVGLLGGGRRAGVLHALRPLALPVGLALRRPVGGDLVLLVVGDEAQGRLDAGGVVRGREACCRDDDGEEGCVLHCDF